MIIKEKMFLPILVLVFTLTINYTSAQTKFAIIGDYGNNSSNELAVANMVKSWNPAFIITTGDNNYPNGRASTIDDNVGKYYQQFIGDYTGGFGSGATSNEFFPSLGNHDWNTTNAQPYIDYFTLPGVGFTNTSGNERYYDFVWDNIHFFAIDSDTDEPDGVTSSSTQGQWLETQLTNCVTNHLHWRIAYDHHPGYCSEKDESYMRWPFESWGAHTVISGHAHTYERLSLDKTNSTAMRFFVNGLGGKSVRPLENPISQSEFQYGGDFGAQLVTVNSTEMILEFYSISDGLVDSWTIQESIPDVTPPEVIGATILDSVTLKISFSELLESSTAQNPNNYSITNGISVFSASLSGSEVILNTSSHSPGIYTVTVSNVTDLSGNIISSSANSSQYEFVKDPQNELTQLQIVDVTASVTPEPEHSPEKTIDGLVFGDGDPDSRWAGDTMPEWLTFDFGTVRNVSLSKLSFYNWNNGRIYNYSISVSIDMNQWTEVVSPSLSSSEEWTINEFQPINARYIKIDFINSNQSTWASLWEGELWGNAPTSVDIEETIPEGFKLEQNYPNPFNPVTTIIYVIPEKTEVSLKIFNSLGIEISTLINEEKTAGSYSVKFDATRLASGIYFYALNAGSYSETKKMILMK